MAIYSTIFLCSDGELTDCFPGMKPALAEPVARWVTDPFTGEERQIITREPEWDEQETDLSPPDFQVVTGHGDYQKYLESRLPPSLKELPYWASKNLTSVQLDPVLRAVLSEEGAKLEPALFAPPSQGKFIEVFPKEFPVVLSEADAERVNEFAWEWASTMSTPEYTHSVAGERVHDNWTVEDALVLLHPIVDLAKKFTQRQCMYILIEF
jgi:hypothetical protein